MMASDGLPIVKMVIFTMATIQKECVVSKKMRFSLQQLEENNKRLLKFNIIANKKRKTSIASLTSLILHISDGQNIRCM